MANADKERVAKLKADMPAVPKQTKAAAAKEAKAAAKETKTNIPRVKTAYLVDLLHCITDLTLTSVCLSQAGLSSVHSLVGPCSSRSDAPNTGHCLAFWLQFVFAIFVHVV